MKTKFCFKCKSQLLISEFNRLSRAFGGYQSYCRKCQKAYNKSKYRKVSLKELKKYLPERK